MTGGAVDYRYMPFVGNGHLATTIYSDAIYVNGVYNGRLGNISSNDSPTHTLYTHHNNTHSQNPYTPLATRDYRHHKTRGS